MAIELKFKDLVEGVQDDITALFETVFSDSEGPDKGQAIGRLVEGLLAGHAADRRCYKAWSADALVGGIVLSRIWYDDPRTVFILSPVAVATEKQRNGVGQKLVTYGLDAVRALGADAVLTYGDPNY